MFKIELVELTDKLISQGATMTQLYAAMGFPTIGMTVSGVVSEYCGVSFWGAFGAFSVMTVTLTMVLARGHRGGTGRGEADGDG